MRLWITICLMLVGASGCQTHVVLRDNTLQTAATIADLNYQQVLDNVARFVKSPSALPSLAVINNGSVTVADQSSLGGTGTYSPTIKAVDQIGGFPIFNMILNPNVTRGLTENWTLVPVTDIGKTRRLRCAFQVLVCGGNPLNEYGDCLKPLQEFFSTDPEKLACAIPCGWYGRGCEADVPKDACFVGNYHETYVWVMPAGMEGLSLFTLTILQLATTEPAEHTKTVLRKYDAKNELEGTEITTIEPDDESDLPKTIDSPDVDLSSSAPERLLPQKSKGNMSLTPKQLRKRPGFNSLITPHIN